MVEFVTLFLGALVTGPTPVQLQAHEDVAALEIRLDARAVATLRASPWKLEVDFGDRLLPHLLEAVAYAADGREIGRASQWVNLAPKQTELTITLERSRSTGTVAARLGWQSLSRDNEPIGVVAVLDGEPLEVRDPRVIPLPAHDPDALHHLSVALEFPGPLRATAEITFGGGYGDSVSSALTALPVSVEKHRELPPVDEMQGWFRAREEPLRVHSAERGPAEIFVVLSPAAVPYLDRAPRRRSRRQGRPSRPILARDHRLSFVGVRPQLVDRDQSSFIVFPRARGEAPRIDGLRRNLSSPRVPRGSATEPRVADAVAVAGLFAHQSARRRAVVLIAADAPTDASQFAPAQVREYLASIGVPLRVWTPQAGRREAGRWGAARNISTDSLLDNAYRELSRALDRQRVVWLAGLHLPQTIGLAPDVDGVRTTR